MAGRAFRHRFPARTGSAAPEGPWVPVAADGTPLGPPPSPGAPETPPEAPVLAPLGRAAAAAGRALVDLLVPPACPVCRRPVADSVGLCAACFRDLVPVAPPVCDRLGVPLVQGPFGVGLSRAAAADPPAWDRCRAAVLYGPTAGRIVHALKYRDRHETAGLMARMMVRAGADLLGPDAAGAVMAPVPLHRRRLVARRFNQSALLAARIHALLAARAGPPPPALAQALVARVRATPRQVGLEANARAANVADAFAVPRPDLVVGRRVLLVDDVLTSGATAEAVTRALRAAGAAAVDVLVFARVVAGPYEPN